MKKSASVYDEIKIMSIASAIKGSGIKKSASFEGVNSCVDDDAYYSKSSESMIRKNPKFLKILSENTDECIHDSSVDQNRTTKPFSPIVSSPLSKKRQQNPRNKHNVK